MIQIKNNFAYSMSFLCFIYSEIFGHITNFDSLIIILIRRTRLTRIYQIPSLASHKLFLLYQGFKGDNGVQIILRFWEENHDLGRPLQLGQKKFLVNPVK